MSRHARGVGMLGLQKDPAQCVSEKFRERCAYVACTDFLASLWRVVCLRRVAGQFFRVVCALLRQADLHLRNAWAPSACLPLLNAV